LQRKSPVAAAIFAAFALIASSSAHAQVCDERLLPQDQGGFGYTIREPEIRCEGLYESSVRAPSLEVVSYLYDTPRFDLSPQETIQVVAPANPADTAGLVRVRAVALPLKTYYRMDAVLPRGEALNWPVRDVLGPAGLTVDQIGVFGWSGSEADKVFIPVRLELEDGQAAGEGPREAGQSPSPRLSIRLSSDAEKVLWRYKEGETLSDPALAAPGAVMAGRVVSFAVPPGPAVTLQVDVFAKPPDSDDWSALRLKIFRPGP
jgi:hypothetical protein